MGQAEAQFLNVIVRRMVFRRKTYQDVGIRSSDRRRITVREIDATIRQSDVVNNAVYLGGWDPPPDRVLYQVAQESRVFNAHTGRAAQVKLETAGIDTGEEILAEPWKNQRKRSQTGYKEPYQESPPV